jgi:acetyl esterase
LTAGFDPLRDEGRLYADALSKAGADTQYVCFERQIHGFVTMGKLIREAHTALALCGHVMKRHWAGV